MSRVDAIREATRPKLNGRLMLSGPSGAGKTWTALSFARELEGGDMSRVLVIDTERESALTYADVFIGFRHLPWRPPFDPTELADTLGQVGDGRFGTIVTDSFTHFWRGVGGTLDLADGKFGGWKNARPVQEALIEAVLSTSCHVILCVRSKMEYLVSADGKQVTKLGLAPIQDDTLVYEMNVAMDIDLEHRLTVVKSRTPACPVGRMYPAGYETKAAKDYDEWLAGGVPPAAREDVQWVVDAFASIGNSDVRKATKGEFVERFGMPHSLTADKVPDARAWVEARLAQLGDVAADDHGPGHDEEPAQDPNANVAAAHAVEASSTTSSPPVDNAGDGTGGDTSAVAAPEPSPAPSEPPAPVEASNGEHSGHHNAVAKVREDLVEQIIGHVKSLPKPDVVAALSDRGLKTTGNDATLRARLSKAMMEKAGIPVS